MQLFGIFGIGDCGGTSKSAFARCNAFFCRKPFLTPEPARSVAGITAFDLCADPQSDGLSEIGTVLHRGLPPINGLNQVSLFPPTTFMRTFGNHRGRDFPRVGCRNIHAGLFDGCIRRVAGILVENKRPLPEPD